MSKPDKPSINPTAAVDAIQQLRDDAEEIIKACDRALQNLNSSDFHVASYVLNRVSSEALFCHGRHSEALAAARKLAEAAGTGEEEL